MGISLNYLSQALSTFAIVGFLRSKFPKVAIVLGGGLVTSWMRRPGWKDPFLGLVDHLVAGPGEEALLNLAGAGNLTPARLIPNYNFVSSFRPPETPPSDIGNRLRIAPTPPHHPALSTQHSALSTHHSSLTTHHSPYFAPGFILPYSSATGCYWNKCAFCPERAEGSPYVPIPAEQAVKDLRLLVRSTKPVLLHVLDNAMSPPLLRALSEHPPGAPWYGFARVTRDLADPDFCRRAETFGMHHAAARD